MKAVKSIEELKEQTKDEPQDYRMILNGGIFSRKNIFYDEEKDRFEILNGIDDTFIKIPTKKLGKETLIVEAIEKRALIKED